MISMCNAILFAWEYESNLNHILADDADAKPAVQRARPGQAPGAATATEEKGFLQEEVYGTGSSLPDCTHACGACKPCNRVMVSFKCSIAEPCPMVYRCMCKGKCYPVPSS
ncbi:unnamed protein product [Triticum turgidum subsp. durum]|uniref:Epidermal patterning factor-like protein n=1 Tax=Triticum turgidum subsp. durum TaxID=4567 RepID=A0A9R1Q1L5_TRITD|nr:unnamed protein product [Triticum turgidum subsp. durum]